MFHTIIATSVGEYYRNYILTSLQTLILITRIKHYLLQVSKTYVT